jgi:ATP-dependent DNA helicase RecG
MTDNKRKKPQIYMRMAVNVMKKSISEGKNDKPSPHVGAVLVFPDGTVDTAYRGELREGDHAEYTVLDKKNRHCELSGCWLFATLEPCAPGARNAPKVSRAERIVNARISEVWFGIEDKNPKVDHGGIAYLLDNDVKVHQFDPEFHKEIEDANKRFNTWAKMKNTEAKAKKSKPKDYLNEKVMAPNINSLSEEALQKFLTESGGRWKPNSDTFLQELKEMELLEYDEKTNNYLPSGNAILLFGKRPRNKFPQAAVKAKVDFGNGKFGAETFDDPLALIPDEVENWVIKVLPASFDRSKFRAEQVPNFPVL